MRAEAARQHFEERSTWLNRGRQALLRALLRRHAPSPCRDVLDIGAGHGANVETLRDHGTVDVNEMSEASAARLEGRDDVREVFRDPIPDLRLPRTYDLVCATEVLEHIEDDRAATAWVAERLRPGGVFLATVPAYPWMFSDHDRVNLHFRRYTRRTLLAALPGSLRVLSSGYFNMCLFPAAAASRMAWQWRKRWRGADDGSKQSSSLPGPADAAFLAVLRAEARLVGLGLRPPFGLTVYCVARRAG